MDNKSDISKFNKFLSEFLHDIKGTFPEYSEIINTNYYFLYEKDEIIKENDKEILEDNDKNPETNDTQYITEYMDIVEPFLLDISLKNEEIFIDNNPKYFIKDIDFNKIWKEDISNKTKDTIWQYLHTLYVLGMRIQKNENYEVTKLFKDFHNNPDKDSFLEELDESSKAVINMLNNITNVKSNDGEELPKNSVNDILNPDFINNSSIGKIANELANDIDMKDLDINNMGDIFSQLMGGKGGGNNNIMSLLSTVSGKIQNKLSSGEIDQQALLKEATSMLGMLNPNMTEIMKDMGNTDQKNKKNKKEKRKNKNKKVIQSKNN